MLSRLVLTKTLLRIRAQSTCLPLRKASIGQKAPERPSDHKQSRNAEQKQIEVIDSYGEKPYAAMTSGEKIVEGTKDTFYIFVILGGIAVTGFVGYIVFRELFSRETPNGIYTEALKLCRENEELRRILGSPLLGHGEETRRGRRRFVSHDEFMVENTKCMRIQFYLKGPIAEGTVHLEVRKDSSDRYAFRYLFVDSPASRRPIIIIDNRK